MAISSIPIEDLIYGEDRLENKVLRSDRYGVSERVLGRGTWGPVYLGKDRVTGEYVAIKVLEPTETALRQLEERKLNLFSAMEKEALWMTQAKGNVPRKLEFDSNGRPFVVMPIYEEFLDKKLKEWDKNLEERDTNLEEKLSILMGIAEGLGSAHSISGLGRVHGDLKPENIAVDRWTAYVNDWGTATIEYVSGKPLSRGERGFEKTRAPENFSEYVRPDVRSDIFGWGALAYRAFTGEYPMDTSPSFDKKKIKAKIKKHVPRSFRATILRALEQNPDLRQFGGKELLKDWSESMDDHKNHTRLKNKIKSIGATLGIAASAAGFVYCIGKLVDKIPDQETVIIPVEAGSDIAYKGMIYKPGEVKENLAPINIEFEKMDNVEEIPWGTGVDAVFYGMIKRATDDPIAAYLIKCAGDVQNGSIYLSDNFLGPAQASTYTEVNRELDEILSRNRWARDDANPLVRTWAKTVEPVCKRMEKEGKIDLEDLMVEVRVGRQALIEAKTMSGSQDYNIYKTARDRNGMEIIPEKERKFIHTWLSAYQQDRN